MKRSTGVAGPAVPDLHGQLPGECIRSSPIAIDVSFLTVIPSSGGY